MRGRGRLELIREIDLGGIVPRDQGSANRGHDHDENDEHPEPGTGVTAEMLSCSAHRSGSLVSGGVFGG